MVPVAVGEANLDLELKRLALDATADPTLDVATRIGRVSRHTKVKLKPERVQAAGGVEHQQVVGEMPHPPPTVSARGTGASFEILGADTDASHRAPQIHPPLGQHGGLHRLPGREEGEDVAEELVRQGAQQVGFRAAGRAGPLGGGGGGGRRLHRKEIPGRHPPTAAATSGPIAAATSGPIAGGRGETLGLCLPAAREKSRALRRVRARLMWGF